MSIDRRPYLLAAFATVALTAASVTAFAATAPTTRQSWTGMMGQSGCGAPPTLPGTQVRVVLADMSGGPMMGIRSMLRGEQMMLRADLRSVPAGPVSFAAVNHGGRTHELLVLPLVPGASVGERSAGLARKVDEAGSVGEASRACGSGSGEGITVGTLGWVTLTLTPGRYELVCNLPGHYAAGMRTELDVT